MPAPGKTVSAPTADHVTLAADDFPRVEVRYIVAGLDDLADKLVADDHRYRYSFPGPGIPVVDMKIRSTNGCLQYPDQYVIGTDRGHRRVLQPQAGLRVSFAECFHDSLPPIVNIETGIQVALPDSLEVMPCRPVQSES